MVVATETSTFDSLASLRFAGRDIGALEEAATGELMISRDVLVEEAASGELMTFRVVEQVARILDFDLRAWILV